MRSSIRSKVWHRTGTLAVCSGILIVGGLAAGCADAPDDNREQVAFSSAEQV
jgi:hypothetical protein